MKKRLAILAILLAGTLTCAQKPLTVNGSQQQEHFQSHADTEQPEKPDLTARPCASEICKENADNAARCAYYKAHPKEYFKAAIAPANLSNWILAVVGIIGVIVACSSLVSIKGQNKILKDSVAAAQTSAKAATLNAQAFITSDRPWILVDVEVSKDDPDKFLVYGINKGNTPAELYEGHCVCKPYNPKGFVVPDTIDDPIYGPMQVLTVSGDRFPIRTISSKWIKETLGEPPRSMMFLYGQILYWDTFTDRKSPNAEPCITQWVFAFDLSSNSFFRFASNYTKHT